MSKVLKRLRQIADNPEDPALDVLFSEEGFVLRQDFSRNLLTLLVALDAYHPEEAA